MNPEMARRIGALITQHQKFVVAGHYRPDGDVLGCEIALGLTLKSLGKDVVIWNADCVPQKYGFLPRAEIIQKPPQDPIDVDVFLAVDTATYDRLGASRDRIASKKLLINIDHHASNTSYGDINWIEPTAAASGEIVYQFLCANQWPVTPEIASNLFVAISTDTGSFQYSNTTPESLRIGADLIEAGADVAELSRCCFESYPLRRQHLLKLVLSNMKLSPGGVIGSFWITTEMYREAGALPEDSEGLIDHVRAIDSVQVAVLFEEDQGGRVRISLRSKTERINVDTIAKQFGGGGHKAAAGARIKGDAASVENSVLTAIEQAIRSASGS